MVKNYIERAGTNALRGRLPDQLGDDDRNRNVEQIYGSNSKKPPRNKFLVGAASILAAIFAIDQVARNYEAADDEELPHARKAEGRKATVLRHHGSNGQRTQRIDFLDFLGAWSRLERMRSD